MATDTLALPDLLRSIREIERPNGRILSVYLDTSPAAPDKRVFLFRLRDLAKLLRLKLPSEEHDAFEAALGQAEAYLRDQHQPGRRGLALFAASSPAYFSAVRLPRPPPEEMVWDEVPLIEPLIEILGDEPRVAVALVDARDARLFAICFGSIEERRAVADEVPGRHREGGWAALRQSRIARHRDDRLLHHVHHVVAELVLLSTTHPFDRLILGGPPEALAVLRRELPAQLRRRVIGTITVPLFASDLEVVEAARVAGERAQRREEKDLVEALLEARATRRVVVGPEATFAALGEGRVQTLVLADDFRGRGGECPTCHRLVSSPGTCPTCGSLVTPVENLADRTIRQALDRDATVEIVSGDAASLLQAFGGIGAWTRYGLVGEDDG